MPTQTKLTSAINPRREVEVEERPPKTLTTLQGPFYEAQGQLCTDAFRVATNDICWMWATSPVPTQTVHVFRISFHIKYSNVIN